MWSKRLTSLPIRYYFMMQLDKVILLWTLFINQGYLTYGIYIPEPRDYVYENDVFKFLDPYYSNYGVYQQRNVALRCKVSIYKGYKEAQPNIKWERVKDVDDIATLTESHKYSIRNRHFTSYWNVVFLSKLVIRRGEADDSGHYRCRVSGGNHKDLIRYFYVNVNDSVRRPIRLVSQSIAGHGLVEVLHIQKWKGFCLDGFTNIEASIACKSLGYVYGGYVLDNFEPHTNIDVWARTLDCPLSASDLSECAGWGENVDSRHCWRRNPGIGCKGKPINEYRDMTVRLPGSLSEGIVHVSKNGYMGTICNYGVGKEEVNSLCRMMGFIYGGYQYRPHISETRPYFFVKMIVQNLTCHSYTNNIKDCSHAGWGARCTECKCFSTSHLAVKCWLKDEEDLPDGTITLAASNNSFEGRLTIKHKGTWGGIAAAAVGYPEADMFCRILGFTYGGRPLFNQFNEGHGPVWIETLKCPYEARNLSECEFSWSGKIYHFISHDYMRRDAQISCRTQAQQVPKDKFRLQGPKSHHGEGRLEYFDHGHWGTVCHINLKSAEAKLFCSYLGFKYGGKLTVYGWRRNVSNYNNLGPSLIEYIDCPWNATDLSQCIRRDGAHSAQRRSCSGHINDAYLTCKTKPTKDYGIKLLRRKLEASNTGYLQVLYNGTWTNVCSINFNVQSVALICKQLEFRHGGEFKKGLQEDKKSWMYIDCDGKEDNVGQCHIFEHSTYCGGNGYPNAVFIKCYTEEQFSKNFAPMN